MPCDKPADCANYIQKCVSTHILYNSVKVVRLAIGKSQEFWSLFVTIGILYIVATPLGNLQDISARAVETLKAVNVIAAEDTRHSRKLLQHFGINTAMLALHEHNEEQQCAKLIKRLLNGEAIALISDAGTPLVSDPGYHLVRAAHDNGVLVVPIPGPCALITALSAAGLPSDRFVFEGFLPVKQGKRQTALHVVAEEARTIIYYEAPHRIVATITDIVEVLGPDRHIVIARELTKIHETIYGANASALLDWLLADENRQRGEFVILIAGATKKNDLQDLQDAERILKILLDELPAKQAVSLAAKITGQRKNLLYDMSLRGRS